ncbi:hypothetical protein HHI36_008895, partial [Cryptolaemus montrouzieri]
MQVPKPNKDFFTDVLENDDNVNNLTSSLPFTSRVSPEEEPTSSDEDVSVINLATQKKIKKMKRKTTTSVTSEVTDYRFYRYPADWISSIASKTWICA